MCAWISRFGGERGDGSFISCNAPCVPARKGRERESGFQACTPACRQCCTWLPHTMSKRPMRVQKGRGTTRHPGKALKTRKSFGRFRRQRGGCGGEIGVSPPDALPALVPGEWL